MSDDFCNEETGHVAAITLIEEKTWTAFQQSGLVLLPTGVMRAAVHCNPSVNVAVKDNVCVLLVVCQMILFLYCQVDAFDQISIGNILFLERSFFSCHQPSFFHCFILFPSEKYKEDQFLQT